MVALKNIRYSEEFCFIFGVSEGAPSTASWLVNSSWFPKR
jgi:hypothetical protein